MLERVEDVGKTEESILEGHKTLKVQFTKERSEKFKKRYQRIREGKKCISKLKSKKTKNETKLRAPDKLFHTTLVENIERKRYSN